jgi:hypothetical protein
MVTDPRAFDSFEEWREFTEELRSAYILDDPMNYVAFTDAEFPPLDPEQMDIGGWETLPALTVQPHHAVAMPDGRVALPITWLYREGELDPADVMAGIHESPVIVLARDATQDGRWVVDEMFGLCVFGCDGDYYEAKADAWWPSTPAASPQASPAAATDAWLEPVAADECTVESRPLDEIRALERTPAAPVVRQYPPLYPATGSVEEAVILAAREWHACAAYGLPSQRLALESPGYIRGDYPDPFMSASSESMLAPLPYVNELSAAILDPDWRNYMIETEAANGLYLQSQRMIVQPGDVIVLVEGRVGVVLT